MSSRKIIKRRSFLKKSAAICVTSSVAPMILRAETLGLNGRVGPNSRINLAYVGIGKQIGAHFSIAGRQDVQALWVCDVKSEARAYGLGEIKKRGGECKATPYYEDIVNDPSVDAVVVYSRSLACCDFNCRDAGRARCLCRKANDANNRGGQSYGDCL